jgi:hypothetical protein
MNNLFHKVVYYFFGLIVATLITGSVSTQGAVFNAMEESVLATPDNRKSPSDGNLPPVINPVGPQTVCVGEQLTLVVSAVDPDGDSLVWNISVLPVGASFVDNGDGSVTFIWTPTSEGIYCITFSVSDGTFVDSETVCITVIECDTSCCIGIRGDLNGDGDNADIIDLTFLVDFIFRGSGNPGGCPDESDVNSDGDPANILDLTFLVDRVFRGGPAPELCP